MPDVKPRVSPNSFINPIWSCENNLWEDCTELELIFENQLNYMSETYSNLTAETRSCDPGIILEELQNDT